MPDDSNVLEAIGGILQRWNTIHKKKKSESRLRRGLESKLKTTKPLTRRESILLNTQLRE